MSKLKLDKRKQVDRLGPLDYELFRLGKQDVAILTNHYLRSSTSGTYWKRTPDEPDPDLERGWFNLWTLWVQNNRPTDVLEYSGITYHILWDDNGDPIFWHKHGWLPQGWQKEIYHAKQKDLTAMGGMGSGKTAGMAMDLAMHAMTIPWYRGAAVAPQSKQVKEIYRYITTVFEGTPFWDRFVWSYHESPMPYIQLRSDYIGRSEIEFHSVEHDNGKAVKTLEFDEIVLDQAEKFDSLDELTVNLGSRLRGQIKGRTKLGRLIYSANSEENPEIWMRFDMERTDPTNYKSFNPKTWDNPYLTKSQVDRMKRAVSPNGDATLIAQHMGAERPMGRGEHFPMRLVDAGLRPDLDNLMNRRIALQLGLDTDEYDPANVEDTGTNYEWKRRRSREAGIYHWEMPPDFKNGHQYIVVADPGQSNPPDRNSAVIMVWDVTAFPDGPAVMVAFHWVYCDGEYGPFLTEYQRLVQSYKAQNRNAFDSTGTQKGFDELYFAINHLAATGLSMAGNGKFHALNAAKFFLTKHLLQYPTIPHLMSQLTNYKLPDLKIRQDLTMCFCMSALFMQRYFFVGIGEDEEELEPAPKPRIDRHSRLGGHRHARSTAR